MGHEIDNDVKIAFNWFLGFFEEEEWLSRKNNIEQRLSSTLTAKEFKANTNDLKPLAIHDDRIGWYLYLLESFLYHPYNYEPTQGSRVIPFFKRFGSDLDLLKAIDGVEAKVKKLLHSNKNSADSDLFEMATALLWARNDYTVKFIPEAPPDKKPDIKAASAKGEWFIECKRLNMHSEYSKKEREKWLEMWSKVKNHIFDLGTPFLFDITFHIEILSLPDDFMVQELLGKLKFVVVPGILIFNKIWTVKVDFVDFNKVQSHLSKNYVKYPSDQFKDLIAGERRPNDNFTCIMDGSFVRVGEGSVNNQYIDKINLAVGVFWACDSENAIYKKAKDIKKRLSEAVNQIPKNESSVVHIGIETIDGQDVEKERFIKILNTVETFDFNGKDLKWIYCHLFQAYAPPDKAWVHDETIYYFNNITEKHQPLRFNHMITPEEHVSDDGVHWLKDPP